MSSYVALLDGGKREVKVEVKETSPGIFEVKAGDEVHVVDVHFGRHLLQLLVDGACYQAVLDPRGDQLRVRVGDSTYPMELLDERRLRLRHAAGKFHAEGKQNLTSAMPGKVVKILVKVGDEVKEGQGLVVVEAMKMENEMKSPKDGKVVEIFVDEGEAVEGNSKLLAVE
ncbi:MAG: biotin/lipoyl-binding protein [Anaeromyxobacteraceae bacterium]